MYNYGSFIVDYHNIRLYAVLPVFFSFLHGNFHPLVYVYDVTQYPLSEHPVLSTKYKTKAF